MSTCQLSVVICTHNPRIEWLERVLEALRAQSLALDRWELLIIDNCSADPLTGRLQVAWHTASRIVREDKLGLTPARLRGIREVRGEMLVFVDDDNVLDPDYLEQALLVSDQRPWLGAWSGQSVPEFEVEPEAWTRRYWGALALREFDEDLWSNLPRLAETMPSGAGLCLRRAVAAEYLRLHDEGVRRFQFDRTGDSLISGGDNDLAGCACTIGLGVGLVSKLKLTHLIPTGRTTADYLARLIEGIAYSSVILDHAWGLGTPQRNFPGRLLDALRLARLKQPHRQMQRASMRGRDRALAMLAARQLEG